MHSLPVLPQRCMLHPTRDTGQVLSFKIAATPSGTPERVSIRTSALSFLLMSFYGPRKVQQGKHELPVRREGSFPQVSMLSASHRQEIASLTIHMLYIILERCMFAFCPYGSPNWRGLGPLSLFPLMPMILTYADSLLSR